MARKTKPKGPRSVECYLCRHALTVDAAALSTTCPGCHRSIVLEDLVLKKNRPKLVMVSVLQTCGRLVVPKGSRVVAELVEANVGLEVLGHMEAKLVRSGGTVVIGKKAYWRGALEAATVVVDPTAVIEGAQFHVSGADAASADHPT